jgi:hypothetical protein
MDSKVEEIEFYVTNKLQTPINEELKESLPNEVWQDLLYNIAQIKFLQNLMAPEEARGYAKDKEREEYNDNGDTRIVIDTDSIVNPHILEDMDYFRESAIFFEKHGRYTNLPPSRNPNSEYYKFWEEEQRRWIEGIVRPSDGEWIPGSFYFYLNYCPILKNEEVVTKGNNRLKKKKANFKDKKARGKRLEGFPDVWLGDYLWFHYKELARDSGAHCSLLKCRQRGFSYKAAAEAPLNMHIMADLPNYYVAVDSNYLIGLDGIMPKSVTILDWISQHTPFPRLRLVDKVAEKKLGYKDDYGVEKGLKSSMSGISVKDNPDKARGIRSPFILYEEGGTIDALEQIWNINRNAVEEGNIVFGLMIAGGTGGTKGAKFDGLRKLFYSPDTYNVLGLPNVFDRGADGSKKVGFFWPEYLNRKGTYDKNGNPNVIEAVIHEMLERYKIKYSSSDVHALTQYKAEQPLTPQEAILRVDARVFPVADLKDIKEKLVLNANFDATHYIGRIGIHNGMFKFEPEHVYPIRDFPLKDNINPGAIEIFELPKTIGIENVPAFGRYVGALDPYANDAEVIESNSIGSFLILDLLTDRIVAEYSGRPVFTDDYFEICMRLAQYYNARILYESNIKGFYHYASNQNMLWMLMDRPEILSDKDFVKGSTIGNTTKGFPSHENIKAWGRTLIREWLLAPAVDQPEGIDPEDQFAKVRNMHTLRSPALLEELITWNPDGNFDRVSALIALMIARAEYRGKFLHTNQEATDKVDGNYITQSKFFKGFMDKHKKAI